MATSVDWGDRELRLTDHVSVLTGDEGGRYPSGTPYDATDPELLMWVHATLVDTSLRVYTRYAGSLTIADKQRYYEEQKLLG